MDEEEDVEVLSEMILDVFMDYPGFADWFDSITQEKTEEIYEKLDDTIYTWLNSDVGYDLEDE